MNLVLKAKSKSKQKSKIEPSNQYVSWETLKLALEMLDHAHIEVTILLEP